MFLLSTYVFFVNFGASMHEHPERPYHHGDLKRALVETALGMLRDGRGWQFTLREVARRAGVSHAAPYKHFPDKAALLAELAAQGYRQLRDELLTALARKDKSPRSALLAVAKAYIAFGLANASLYRLMHSSELDKSGNGDLHDASLATYEVVLDILTRGQRLGVFRAAPVQGQAAACWALVHGLTTLELDGQLLAEKVGAKPVDAALASLLEGLDV
jgi:AcrR family transcriptional regulator